MTSMGQAVKTDLTSYDLSGTLADERLSEIPAGANLLISGPSLIGKDRLALELLTNGQPDDRPVVLVSSDQSAEKLLGKYRSIETRTELDEMYIVDCSGASGRGSFQESKNIKYVSSPGDLTGIGMGIAKCTNELGNAAENGVGFGVLSLSTLLQYSSENRVFNFTHVMTGRISAAGYLGLWTLDSASHDEMTLSTLRGQFDFVAEVREDASDNREIRILGGKESWRSWKPMTP